MASRPPRAARWPLVALPSLVALCGGCEPGMKQQLELLMLSLYGLVALALQGLLLSIALARPHWRAVQVVGALLGVLGVVGFGIGHHTVLQAPLAVRSRVATEGLLLPAGVSILLVWSALAMGYLGTRPPPTPEAPQRWTGGRGWAVAGVLWAAAVVGDRFWLAHP